MFAPKWEKVLFRTVADGDYGALEKVAISFPEARPICMLLDAFLAEGPDGDARGKAILEELWATGFDPSRDRFLSTYAPGSMASVTLAPGVRATMPLSRDLIGLTLAELRQEVGDLAGAVGIVESLEPSLLAAVSLAELYIAQRRWDDVIELTNGIPSTDDFSCFLLAQRGVAFREKGYHDAARESFKAALSRRSQPVELKHHTLAERAFTYQREGKLALARRDYERILAEDPHYPGLAEALAALA
jgi:tetratricopeptide (TPR) repeat protein